MIRWHVLLMVAVLLWGNVPAASGPATLDSPVLQLALRESRTAAGAPIDPALLEAPPSQPQPFIVLMKTQADLTRTLPAARVERIRAVANLLRQQAAREQAPLLSWLLAQGVAHHSLFLVNAVAIIGDRTLMETLAARPDVERLEPNYAVRSPALPPARGGSGARSPDIDPLTDGLIPWGVQDIQAPLVWDVYGVTGQGIVVGSVDSGVDWDHPALQNHYRGWNGSTANHAYNWHDAIGNSIVPFDDEGHGTHTTGTIVGGIGNTHIGVAPGAKWIACKSMNSAGLGSAASFVECLEWMLEPTDLNGDNPDASKAPHLVNNSWGCRPIDGCATGTLLIAIQNLRAAGIMVMASAGNLGPACGTVTYPIGIYDEVLTTGAYNDQEQIITFSSRGPVTSDGSGRMKPDLAAPGWRILSSIPGGGYGDALWSGTSMASAHTSGAVALVWAADPSAIGQIETTEQILLASSRPRGDNDGCGEDLPGQVPNNRWGNGMLNALTAVQTVLEEATVTGRVIHADSGDLLTGAQVVFTNTVTAAVYSVTTDENGRYAVYLSAGTYDITASYPGYQVQFLDDYTIEPGQQLVLDFALALPGPLAGTVTDVQTQAPLNGATVKVQPQSGGAPLYATANADGYYEISLNVGVYDVIASATSHLSKTVPGVAIQDSVTTTLNFALQGYGTLTGVVSQSGTGQPLAGAQLQATRPGQSPVIWTTDANGAYSQILVPGTYTLTVSFIDHEPHQVSDIAVTTGSASQLNFALRPVGRVQGWIRDRATGQPIPAAVVTANDGSNPPRLTNSDGSGAYSLTLPAAIYTISVTHNDYAERQVQDYVIDLGVTSLLNLYLDGEGRLQGTVQDSEGIGLDGASVTAGNGQDETGTWTQAGGGYSFRLPQGTYTVTAEAGPGYTTDSLAGIAITTGVTTVVDFELQSQGVLSGSLQDGIFGGGLPQGQIAAQGPTGDPYVLVSDDQGSFQRTLLSGLYTLTGTYTGYVPSAVAGVVISTGATTVQPVVLTPYTGTLTGTVEDAQTGQPLLGASVVLVNQASGVRSAAISGAGGSFELTAPVGGALVTASHAGYADSLLPIEITSGQTATLNFSLEPGGVLHGMINSSWNGAAVASALVQAYPQGGGQPIPVLADVQGLYTLTLPTGIYTVTASATGFFPQTVANTQILPGGDVVRDFTLLAATGTLSGTTRSAHTGAGLAGVTLEMVRESDGLSTSTSSVAGGDFNLAVPVGSYQVSATLAGYVPAALTGVVVATDTTTLRDLVLWPLGTVSGQITAVSGGPLAGAQVHLDGGPDGPAVTVAQADGTYLATVKVGTYTLEVSHPGYETQVQAGVAITSSEPQVVNFVLQGVGLLTGTVRNSQTLAPLSSVSVEISGPQTLSVWTAATGVYSADLQIGDYTVAFRRAGFDPLTKTTAIRAGQITLLSTDLTPVGFLSGTITDSATDEPLPGIVVSAYDVQNRHFEAVTDFGGVYSFTLQAGAYTVSIVEWAYEPLQFSATIPAGGISVRNWGLAPIPPAPILVIDDDAGGVEDVAVGTTLAGLGEAYQTWDAASWGSISDTVLAPYCAVIWLTGDDAFNTFTATEQDAIEGYVDGVLAPHLLVSGDDIGYDLVWRGSTSDRQFFDNYLHAYYVNENSSSFGGQGLGFLNGISFLLTNDGAVGDHGLPSRIYPRSAALDILHYGDGTSAGSAWDQDTQMAYWGFKFSSLSSAAARQSLLETTLYWFGCGTGSCPADVNRDHQVNIVDIMQAVGHWGQDYQIRFDVNRDGLVDLLDVVLVAESWNAPCS